MRKKLLSSALALAMVLSLFPAGALAAASDYTIAPVGEATEIRAAQDKTAKFTATVSGSGSSDTDQYYYFFEKVTDGGVSGYYKFAAVKGGAIETVTPGSDQLNVTNITKLTDVANGYQVTLKDNAVETALAFGLSDTDKKDFSILAYKAEEPVAPTVAIEGTAKVGQTLTAKVTDAQGAAVTPASYVWKAGDTVIETATGATYKLTEAEKGKTITVTVTVEGKAYTSEPTAAVAAADAPQCTCTTKCETGKIDENCPVCSAGGADLDKVCQGVKMYTVTLDANGGAWTDGSKTMKREVKAGEKLTEPAKPEREGYAFVNWMNGSEAYNFDAAVTGDITLKALWEEVLTGDTVVSVEAKTDGEGNVTAEVKKEDMAAAIEKAEQAEDKTVTVAITGSTGNEATATIEPDSITAAKDANVKVEIKVSGVGGVTLPTKALEVIAEQIGTATDKKVEVTVDKADAPKTPEAMRPDTSKNTYQTFGATVKVGGTEIETGKWALGSARITLEFQIGGLPTGVTKDHVKVWYVNGTSAQLETGKKMFNMTTGIFSLEVSHLSERTVEIPNEAPATPAPSGGGGGGGGSSSGYSVGIGSASNGKVTASPSSASKGDKVTLTVKPDSGYELDSLMVKDKDGNVVTLTNIGDGKYTFTMPAGKVTVTPVFVEKEPEQIDPSARFVDVPADAYYAKAVAWALENDITSGTSANTFSPWNICTRGEMVTFLWKVAGCPAPKGSTNAFADVPANAYYRTAVQWAVENGITSGTGATTFSPNAVVTRAQTVAFLYKAAGSPAVGSGTRFADVPANAYYTDAVRWVWEQGIASGTGPDTFSPGNNCTRAEIVTLLYNANN